MSSELRESKATYANEDPASARRRAIIGNLARKHGGRRSRIKSDEVQDVDRVGRKRMAGFTENLQRMLRPGDEIKNLDVTYPEDYGQEKLSGKTIRFKVGVKGVRRERAAGDQRRLRAGSRRFPHYRRTAAMHCGNRFFAQRRAEEAQREAKDKAGSTPARGGLQ